MFDYDLEKHKKLVEAISCEVEQKELVLMLKGYELVTAQIIYKLPDHPLLLQSYLWQEYDLCPKLPILKDFLGFWESKLEGKIMSVEVSHMGQIITPPDIISGSEINI